MAWSKTMTSSPKVTLQRKKKIEYLVDDIHEPSNSVGNAFNFVFFFFARLIETILMSWQNAIFNETLFGY